MTALILDGREVECRPTGERVVDVAALGTRRMVRAVETREPTALVYRWITDGLPFAEERFELTMVDARTTDVTYEADVDRAPIRGGGRSLLLMVRLRRTAGLRLDGLRALVGSPAGAPPGSRAPRS